MEIINKKLSEITPYEKNPRINANAVEAVMKSIHEFGFRQPIVVDGNMVIICGHTRWKAAQELGLEEVPVHIARDLTPEQIKAYRIADNKTGELAEWNYDLLPLELTELQEADFDLSLLGFDESELDKLLNGEADDVLVEGETEPTMRTIGNHSSIHASRYRLAIRAVCHYTVVARSSTSCSLNT